MAQRNLAMRLHRLRVASLRQRKRAIAPAPVDADAANRDTKKN